MTKLKIQEGETEVTKKVIDMLNSKGIPFEKIEHQPVTTSSEAAGARGSKLSQGAKALVVKANDKFYHLIISAEATLDNNKLRKVLKARRVRFATPEELYELTGCAQGAVPPFGNLFGLPVLMDNALLNEDIVYFNCGSHTVSLRMSRSDMQTAAEAIVADFHKSKTEITPRDDVLPSSFDLSVQFNELGLQTRSQGNRGTCSVFAVVGALEYALSTVMGRGLCLSVEFLNWASHKVSGRRTDGAFFSELWQGYSEYGICEEKDLPYLDRFCPDLEPTEDVLEKAKLAHSVKLQMHWIKEWDVTTGLTEEQLTEIKRVIYHKFPVCCGLRWPRSPQWINGVLQSCPPSEVFDGHSILIVGYKDDQTYPGKGLFIIRNSGGDSSEGCLTYEYVMSYTNDAMWIEPAG